MDPDELVLTVAEIADKLKLDTDTVRRLFGSEPGVIVIYSSARAKRIYRTLRVPARVVLRVLTRLTPEFRWRLEDLDLPVFTVDDVALKLKLATDTARRLLTDAAGVTVICFPTPGKRTYRTHRVAARAFTELVARHSFPDQDDTAAPAETSGPTALINSRPSPRFGCRSTWSTVPDGTVAETPTT